tara:strand:+ start:1147 stop:2205 length:1059 start_codon:yes stop_codon:yes gene_type:complete
MKILHLIKGNNGGLDNLSKKIFNLIESHYNQKIFYFYPYGNKFYKKFKRYKLQFLEYKNEVVFVNLFKKIKELIDAEIIHVHHTKIWILLSPLLLFKNKIIYSFHGNFGVAIKKNLLQKLFIRLIIDYCTLFSRKLIFLTQGQKRNLLKYASFKKTFLKKAVMINNFVNKKDIIYKKKNKNKDILFVGRYEKLKGFWDLLKVSRNTKKINFYFMGDNKMKTKQKNIINYGKIDNNKILKYYDKHSIFILPSYTEAFPITILEAMARGLVILVSDIPGMREIVKEGRNGYLFPPGDTEKMKKLILYLKNNPKEIERISKNNLKDIHKFTAEKQVPKYLKIYNEVLRENKKNDK